MKLFVVFALLSLSACAQTKTLQTDSGYLAKPEVRAFISEMVDEGFEREFLERAFEAAQYQQNIIDSISRPAERTLTWATYQDIFLSKRRADAGTAFIAEHMATFERAEQTYGVPVHVIAAIIGVETFYGRITGKHRVIDSLSTLAFDYPPRSKFFRSELKEFFRLVREEQQDPITPLGSYAGAMGYGQFISSSYRHYAVDFDGDGIRDIWNNPVDAIGSVANYLSRHGWQANEAIIEPARLDKEIIDPALFNQSLKPYSTLGELAKAGVSIDLDLDADTAVTPTRLMGKEGEEYWIGLKNFYVITRYNHSKLYAMAVFQLSERIKASLPA